jgi:hypothetical protein
MTSVSPETWKEEKNMPARDLYHNQVKEALMKDGWHITDDPLHLKWGVKDLYVDLGAEQLLAAEKAECKIAVEIKSFVGTSEMAEFEKAIGQYMVYGDVLDEVEPERQLYLAVNEYTYVNLFEEPIGQLLVKKHAIKLLVFDPMQEVIVKWIN